MSRGDSDFPFVRLAQLIYSHLDMKRAAPNRYELLVRHDGVSESAQQSIPICFAQQEIINQKRFGRSQLHPLVPARARMALTLKSGGCSIKILRTMIVNGHAWHNDAAGIKGMTFSRAAPS